MSFFNKNYVQDQYDDGWNNQTEGFPVLDSECKIVDKAVKMEPMVKDRVFHKKDYGTQDKPCHPGPDSPYSMVYERDRRALFSQKVDCHSYKYSRSYDTQGCYYSTQSACHGLAHIGGCVYNYRAGGDLGAHAEETA